MIIEITKQDYDNIESKMRKGIDNLQENLNAIRAGRANPHVLDKITVDYWFPVSSQRGNIPGS